MLYNKSSLRIYMQEALIISLFYNKENNYGLENDLTNLYKKVLSIIATHEFYCQNLGMRIQKKFYLTMIAN